MLTDTTILKRITTALSSLGKRSPAARRAKTQLFLNYKGGTGKTSISAAYAYCLAGMGHKVLMVDLDAQAHLTACFNQEGLHASKSIYSVLVLGERLANIIVPTTHPNLKLVPSALSLSSLEMPLYSMAGRERRLRTALKAVENDYDFIIIDSAPSISILGLNAIVAADEILVPLLADFLSFHGLKILLETLASIERDFGYYLGKVHIFLNRYNPGYAVCKECEAAVRRHYPDYVLKTVVSESSEIIDASSKGVSVIEAYPDSQVALEIRSLVDEVNASPTDIRRNNEK